MDSVIGVLDSKKKATSRSELKDREKLFPLRDLFHGDLVAQGLFDSYL